MKEFKRVYDEYNKCEQQLIGFKDNIKKYIERVVGYSINNLLIFRLDEKEIEVSYFYRSFCDCYDCCVRVFPIQIFSSEESFNNFLEAERKKEEKQEALKEEQQLIEDELEQLKRLKEKYEH